MKSGPKLKIAHEEFAVFRMNVIPVKPAENVCRPEFLVKSTEYVRASRGVAFKIPEPRFCSPLMLTLGNAPGPPKLSRKLGSPNDDGWNGTPWGTRPSTHLPQPKLATITNVGEMANE